MTPDELRDARARLGELWGLGRPLRMAELARALRLGGRDPGAAIRDYERGTTRISGPIALAVDLLLAGAILPGLVDQALGRSEPPGSPRTGGDGSPP